MQRTEAGVRRAVTWRQIEGQTCCSQIRCTEQNLRRTVTSLPEETLRRVDLVSSGPVMPRSRPKKPRDGQTCDAPSEAGKPETWGAAGLRVKESKLSLHFIN